MNLRPESKDTSAKAAKDRSHLPKVTSNVMGLKKERGRLDRKRPKIARKRRSRCSRCFYCTQLFKRQANIVYYYKERPLEFLSKSEETEGEEFVDE